MGKVDNFKTFEGSMETKSFKNLHSWGKTEQHEANELEATESILSSLKKKGTPLLDWVNSKGYSIEVHKGSIREGFLDHLGMDGSPYTFYLVPSWNKFLFIEYLNDVCGIGNDDIDKLMNVLGWDIDDLELYGKPQNYFYSFNNGEDSGYGLDEVIDKLLGDDVNLESHGYEIDSSDEIDVEIDCAFWGSLVPLRFNGLPSKGSESYNLLCEYGLTMIKWQIGKLMLCTGSINYDQLISNAKFDYNILTRDTDLVVDYLNKSKLNVSKNEDILWVEKTAYNLYKGCKLLHDNHDRFTKKYHIKKTLVWDFIKNS